MRFGVLSAGSFAGRMISRELSEFAGSQQISIFDSSINLSRAAAQLRDTADVRVAESSRSAIEGASSVVSCTSNLEEALAHASEAIELGIPLLWAGRDIEISEALQQLNDEAVGAGVPVVAGGGWSPGLTNLLALAASQALDSVVGIRIAWAVSATGSGAEEAVATLVESFSRPAPVFESGSWHRKQPGANVEDVYFPEPLGWTTVQVCAGAEPLSLPRSIQGVETVVVKAGAAENTVLRLARMIGDASSLSSMAGRRRISGLANPWLKSIRRATTGGGGWSAIRVDARGKKAGKLATETLGVLDQLANLIAVTPSVAAVSLAMGDAREHGVIPAERAFEPNKFFSALGERGIKVGRLSR